MTIRCTLYQPDIPQNTAAIIRTAVCLGVGVDIVEPMGFLWNEKKMRRAGMDYLDGADVVRHGSWRNYINCVPQGERLVLLTTAGSTLMTDFRFQTGDRIILGRESAGVPADVHEAVDARIVIPLRPAMRSLNVAATAAISMAEALRQLNAFPNPAIMGSDPGD